MGCRADGGFGALILPLEEQGLDTQVAEMHRVSGPECEEASVPGAGHVVYRVNNRVYRMEARPGAKPQDITKALDRLGAGQDGFITTSSDGEWMLVQTSRFGCGEEMCMVLVNRTVCEAQAVIADGLVIRPQSTAALASGGRTIVFPSSEGPHESDLYAVTKVGDAWSAPVLLTQASRSPYNAQPSISADGLHVIFDCGRESGSGEGTSICEVGIDGTGLIERVPSKAGPGGRSANHHASYAPDGSIVFEATWNAGAEQVWRASPGKAPELVNGDIVDTNPTVYRFTDDNSPCVLPDGRVLSLWLGRPAAPGKTVGHELKSMDDHGGSARMVLGNVDVADIGMSCSL